MVFASGILYIAKSDANRIGVTLIPVITIACKDHGDAGI